MIERIDEKTYLELYEMYHDFNDLYRISMKYCNYTENDDVFTDALKELKDILMTRLYNEQMSVFDKMEIKSKIEITDV